MLTDTTPEADELILQLLRQTPIWRKLQMMTQLNDMTRVLALGSLRQQFPQAADDDLQRLLADRLLGVDLAEVVYGPRPQLEETGNNSPAVGPNN